MKPYLICLLAFLFSIFQLSAQDDILKTLEIAGVKKITAAIGHGNHVAFCTKNKWGIYDADQKKIMVEPTFQRIAFLPDDSPAYMNGFFGVIKNKLGYFTIDGKQLIAPAYSFIGFFSNERATGYDFTFAITDSKILLIKPDSLGNGFTLEDQNDFTERSFLSAFKRFSITVKNELLVINDFEDINNYQPDPYYRYDEFGTRIDSLEYDASGQMILDASGNPKLVYPPPYPGYSKSGVFDYKKQVWLVPAEFAKIIVVPNGFAAYKKNTDTKNHPFLFSFYSHNGDVLVKENSLDIIANDALAIQKILALKSIPSLKLNGTAVDHTFNEFKLNVSLDGLTGIYDLNNMRWIIPTQYKFIYETDFGLYATATITMKNGKFGAIIYRNNNTITVPNNYSTIGFKFRNMYDSPNEFLYLDSELYIFEMGALDKEVLKIIPTAYIYNSCAREFSISLDNKNFVVITNRQENGPQGEMPYGGFDAFGTRIDSIMVDLEGKPVVDAEGFPRYVYPLEYYAYNKSGVFNLSENKWTVPQEFKRIASLPTGFASYNDNKNRIDGEHNILMSFYNKQGDAFFKDVPLNHVAENTSFVKVILGLSDIPSLKVFDDPAFHNYENTFPVLVSFSNKMGVFDLMNLQWIIPMEYDRIDKSNVLGHYIIYKDAKMGIVNHAGKIIVPPLYTELKLIPGNNLLTNNGLVYNVNVDAQTVGEYVAPYSWLSTQTDEQYSPDYKLSFHAFIKGENIFVNEWSFNRYTSPYMRYDNWGTQIDSIKYDDKGNVLLDETGNVIPVFPPDQNNAWARMYDLKSIYNYEFDSVRSIEEIPLGYLLETKNSEIYLVDKNFNPLSKLAYSRYEKHGDVYFLQRENRDYIVNAEGFIARFDGSYIDGSMLNAFYDVVTPQKFIQLARPKHLVYYFPSGTALVYEVKADAENEAIFDVKFSYLDMNTMKEIVPRINTGGNQCSVLNVNDVYRISYYSYFITEEYVVRASANGFDTISKTSGNVEYNDFYNKTFYPKINDENMSVLDFDDKLLFSGKANAGEPVVTVNLQRYFVYTKPYARLCNNTGKIIADSLENIIPFTFDAINRVPIAVFAADKKGEQYVFNMDGKVIFDLGSVNDMSRFVNITRAADYLDIYQVEQGLVRIPFRFKNGEVVPFTQEPLNLFQVINTSETQLIGAKSATSSFIADVNGKMLHSFKPQQELFEIFDDSTAVIYDSNDKLYHLFYLKTKAYVGNGSETSPVKLYAYTKNDTAHACYIFKENNNQVLTSVLKTPKQISCEIISQRPIDSYKTINYTYLLISNQKGKLLYNMEKQSFLTTFEYDKIKPVQTSPLSFILSQKNITYVYVPEANHLHDLGSTQIDSLTIVTDGWSFSGDNYYLYLHNKNKKGWFAPQFSKFLAPEYNQIAATGLYNGSDLLAVNNNLYRKSTGEFIFPADEKASYQNFGSGYVCYTAPTLNKKHLFNTSINKVQEIDADLKEYLGHDQFTAIKNKKLALYDANSNSLFTDHKHDVIEKLGVPNGSEPKYTFKLNRKTGVLSFVGKQLVAPKYDSIIVLYCNDSLSYYGYMLNGKWGLMTMGQKIITPAAYSSISTTDYGFLITTLEIPSKIKNRDPAVKYGLCSVYGKEVIPCRFDDYSLVDDETTYIQGQIGKKWYKVLKTIPAKLEEVKE